MLQEDKGAAQGLLNILGQPQPAESVMNRSSVPTQVTSTSEDWTWRRSQRWDSAPWVKELPKRRTHLRLRPDQGTDMLLSKTSFGSNQGLVANGLQVFCPCCMHRHNFPALFLKLMSNNLRSVHAQEKPMSRGQIPPCFLWKSPASHLTTPSEALLITQLCPLLVPLLLLPRLFENVHDLFQLSMERSAVRQI